MHCIRTYRRRVSWPRMKIHAKTSNAYGTLSARKRIGSTAIVIYRTDDAECSSTIEDYRSVHDAKCMKRASHLTDLAAGTRECQLLSTKGTCTNNPSCFWYTFSIPSVVRRLPCSGFRMRVTSINGITTMVSLPRMAIRNRWTRFDRCVLGDGHVRCLV